MSSYALDLVLEIGEDPPRARGAAHQDRPGSQSHVFGLRGRALDAADGLDERAVSVRRVEEGAVLVPSPDDVGVDPADDVDMNRVVGAAPVHAQGDVPAVPEIPDEAAASPILLQGHPS